MLNPVNGLWFSLGWCIFFFIPLIIFALLLVSLYRREEEYDPSKEFDDPNFSMYAGSDPDTIPLTRVNNQNGVHGGANYPGVANSGYHREDQFAGKAPPYNYSGYREPIDQFQNNDMYYRGSKEPPPPAYSGGGHQVYPSDYELDLYQGHHSKSPKYPVQY